MDLSLTKFGNCTIFVLFSWCSDHGFLTADKKISNEARWACYFDLLSMLLEIKTSVPPPGFCRLYPFRRLRASRAL